MPVLQCYLVFRLRVYLLPTASFLFFKKAFKKKKCLLKKDSVLLNAVKSKTTEVT